MDTLLLGKPRKWGGQERRSWETGNYYLTFLWTKIVISPFGGQKLLSSLWADTNSKMSINLLVLTAIDLKMRVHIFLLSL